MKNIAVRISLGIILNLIIPWQGISNSFERDSVLLSLGEAIEYALANNLEIEGNRLDTEQQSVDYLQSRAALLPSLNAVSAYNFNLGRSINPVTNEFTSNPVNSQDYGIQSQVVIFDGLKTIHQINAAKAAVAGGKYQLEATKREITLQVINAYLQVLLKKELVASADQARQATEERIAKTRALVLAGEVAEFEVLQLQSQLADEQVSYTNALAEYNNARMQLRQVLLVPESRKIEVRGLTQGPDEAMDPNITHNKNDVPLNAAMSQSREYNPAIANAETQIILRQHELAAAKSDYLPRVTAQAGIFTSYSNDPPPFLERNNFRSQLDFNLRRYIGIELTVPIFNNFRTRSNIARARIGMERSLLNKASVVNEHNQQIELVYQDLVSAEDIYESAYARFQTKALAYESLVIRFELGEASIFELTQAKNEWVQAESFHAQSKYRLLFFQKVWHYVLTNETPE